MPYESPYQSMVENEVLFQQQPWLKRIPHQIRHAVRPVEDALTGAGAGVVAGAALGSPRAGAVVGGVLGGLHGVMARSPTAAQEWAFNNPELVHVLKARAAYDAGDGFEMGKAAHEKVAISSAMVQRAYAKRLIEEGDGGPKRVVNLFRILRPEDGPMSPPEAREPSIRRGDQHATLGALISRRHLDGPPLPEELDRAARIQQRDITRHNHLEAARKGHLDATSHAVEKMLSEIDKVHEPSRVTVSANPTPKAPVPAPVAAPSAPAAPKSNLRRNLGIGAAAIAIPAIAYTAYRHFADKPDAEKAREAGKTAMLRTLGF